ncbi:hypothetical protein [Nonomuraea sp. NPDC049400]|uniref:hypothetical protein n=1 Tax=Nonomuraea sp. NPDC049400 TaxID=3364352 RepID=UPI003795D9E2
MSKVYLHKLDVFAEKTLIPEFTRRRLRGRNQEYRQAEQTIVRARRAEVPNLADDTLLGFAAG